VIAHNKQTTGLGHITVKDLQNIKIAYPKEDHLININSNIRNYYEQILSNLLENQTLSEIRDTLLPKLISGEVRVKV
jgi:type I restriction enzyme, S subunit